MLINKQEISGKIVDTSGKDGTCYTIGFSLMEVFVNQENGHRNFHNMFTCMFSWLKKTSMNLSLSCAFLHFYLYLLYLQRPIHCLQVRFIVLLFVFNTKKGWTEVTPLWGELHCQKLIFKSWSFQRKKDYICPSFIECGCVIACCVAGKRGRPTIVGSSHVVAGMSCMLSPSVYWPQESCNVLLIWVLKSLMFIGWTESNWLKPEIIEEL